MSPNRPPFAEYDDKGAESPETDDENQQERFLLHVGQQGSGKTFALEEDTLERVELGRRVLVKDNKREWTAFPPSLPICEVCIDPQRAVAEKCKMSGSCVVVPDLPTAQKRIEKTGFVVLRPLRDRRLGTPPRREISLIERIASWALDTRNLDLVIPEAHMDFALEDDLGMGVQTRQLITQYRSYGIAVALDTQFFASISMKVRKSVNTYRIFGLASGTPDMEQVRKLGGPALVAAIEECAKRHAAGQPGWHVFLDPRNPANKPQIERF